MTDTTTAISDEEIKQRQELIMKLSHDLARTIVRYLFDIGATGHTTPVPPRPKQPVLDTVNYAARTLDAFTASAGLQGF